VPHSPRFENVLGLPQAVAMTVDALENGQIASRSKNRDERDDQE
jgi:hypothetical protein